MRIRPLAALAFAVLLSFTVAACVDDGEGSDFDLDGVPDQIEDPNDNFLFDQGESDFNAFDTDLEGVCDGLPEDPNDVACVRCEDCDNDGKFEPCLSETDPLNNDTDNDGASDRDDGAPLDAFAVDCATVGELAYGASLPAGKPFPVRPTATPFPTLTPLPGSTAPPTPDPNATPTPLPPLVQTAVAAATLTAAAGPTPTPAP
jgi:hypothetical protein